MTNNLHYSSVDSSLISSNMVAASSSIVSTQQSIEDNQNESLTSAAAIASPSFTADEEASQLREKITNDLENWQQKFAKAADKGTEDLEERVKDITNRQIESQVHGVGKSLVIELEESTISELAKLKNTINKVIRSLPEDSVRADLEKAEAEITMAVRQSGLNIKSKAQSLRSWRQNFEEETQSLVSAASESTLEVIDNIRDLGLQEIGMRWAWMEGVTYKDWSKYHALKKTFDEWRIEVEAVADNHRGLHTAKAAADEVESTGMEVAESTAKELARLKAVGIWKVHAGDSSDDFNTRTLPAKAAAAAHKVNDKLSSASSNVVGTSQGSVESLVSLASEAVSGSSTPLSESIASSASSQLSKVTEAVIGTTQSKMGSVYSAASKKADQLVMEGSQAVIGTPAPLHQSIASEVSKSIESASSGISVAISGSPKPLSESASDVASSATASVSSMASRASKKVLGGAMAQHVEERIPIFDDLINEDDDESYSKKLQSIVSQAGDKYAEVTRAVSEAMLVPTSTPGAIEGITYIANEKYLSALDVASSVLYGTQQGTAASISSVASEKYASAVAAWASFTLYESLLTDMITVPLPLFTELLSLPPRH